jgi:hypothetical protein
VARSDQMMINRHCPSRTSQREYAPASHKMDHPYSSDIHSPPVHPSDPPFGIPTCTPSLPFSFWLLPPHQSTVLASKHANVRLPPQSYAYLAHIFYTAGGILGDITSVVGDVTQVGGSIIGDITSGANQVFQTVESEFRVGVIPSALNMSNLHRRPYHCHQCWWCRYHISNLGSWHRHFLCWL